MKAAQDFLYERTSAGGRSHQPHMRRFEAAFIACIHGTRSACDVKSEQSNAK